MAKLCALLALVALARHCQAEVSTQQNPICKQVISGNVRNVNLRATLIFPSALYLVTEDWLVYKVPNDKLAKSGLQLNTAARPIEQEWPALEKIPHFGEHKDQLAAIYSVSEQEPLLYFEFKNKSKSQSFNIKNGSLQSANVSLIGHPLNSNGKVITVTKQKRMYSITNNSNVLQLIVWPLTINRTNLMVNSSHNTTYNMYYVERKGKPSGEKKIAFARKPIVNASAFANLTLHNITNWPLPLIGFVEKKHVRLFDNNSVYLFDMPRELPHNTSENIKLIFSTYTRVQSKDYFHCVRLLSTSTWSSSIRANLASYRSTGRQTFQTEEVRKSTSTKKGVAMWPIIVLVIVVVGCLTALLLTYLVLKFSSKKRRQRKKGGKKKTHKKSSVKEQVTTPASVEVPVTIKQASIQDLKMSSLKNVSNQFIVSKENNTAHSLGSGAVLMVPIKQSITPKLL